jgi:acyl carrier protein
MATRSELENAIFQALHRVAPEADLAHTRRDADLRDELDIDSMDFLSFVTALHQTLNVEIAEKDYPKLASIDGALAFLAAAVGSAE